MHKADTIPDVIDSAYLGKQDVMRIAYHTKENKEAVVFYKIKDMGHAIPIDPGFCDNEGGKTGLFATDKNFYSTFYTACEFGLVPDWNVNGPTEVVPGSKIKFWIQDAGEKKSYSSTWSVPKDCTIISDANGTSIEVIWGKNPGSVTITEMAPNSCRYYHNKLQVKLKNN